MNKLPNPLIIETNLSTTNVVEVHEILISLTGTVNAKGVKILSWYFPTKSLCITKFQWSAHTEILTTTIENYRPIRFINIKKRIPFITKIDTLEGTDWGPLNLDKPKKIRCGCMAMSYE